MSELRDFSKLLYILMLSIGENCRLACVEALLMFDTGRNLYRRHVDINEIVRPEASELHVHGVVGQGYAQWLASRVRPL